MITRTLFSDTAAPEKEKGNVGSYFVGELKRSWTRAVLYFIVIMLCFPVAILMEMTGNSAMDFEDILPLFYVLVMCIAVCAGLSATSYLSGKSSSVFLHSVPLKRENIFFVKYSVGAIDFLAALFLNSVLVLIILLTEATPVGNVVAFTDTILYLIGILGNCCIAFVTIYSITTLSGVLGGTQSMQFLLSLFFNFVILVYYICFYAVFLNYSEYIYADYYATYESFCKIAPILRFASISGNPLTWGEAIGFLIFSALIVFLSLFIYKHRKVERAGTPIVFSGFASVLKYLIIIPSTIFLGLFFESMAGNGGAWTVAGLALGAILSFMLVNTVLHKSARSMFQGKKGFAVYCVVFSAVFACIVFNAFGIDGYVPNADNVSYVKISCSPDFYNVSIYDKAVIEESVSVCRDYIEKSKRSYYSPSQLADFAYPENSFGSVIISEKYYVGKYNESFFFPSGDERILNMKFTFVTKSGLHIALKNINIAAVDRVPLLVKIADSEDFEKALIAVADDSGSSYFNTSRFLRNMTQYEIDNVDKSKLCNVYEGIDYSSFQQQYMGNFFGSGSSVRMELPVFADFESKGNIINDFTIEDFYEKYADSVNSITVARKDENSVDGIKKIDIFTREQILETIKSVYTLSHDSSVFTEYSDEYSVIITFKWDENGDKYEDNLRTFFLADKIPDFIESELGH